MPFIRCQFPPRVAGGHGNLGEHPKSSHPRLEGTPARSDVVFVHAGAFMHRALPDVSSIRNLNTRANAEAGRERTLSIAMPGVRARVGKYSAVVLRGMSFTVGGGLRLRGAEGARNAREHCGASRKFVALCGVVASAGRISLRLAGGIHAAGARESPGEAVGRGRALREERRGLFSLTFVQGPRGGRGADGGAAIWI